MQLRKIAGVAGIAGMVAMVACWGGNGAGEPEPANATVVVSPDSAAPGERVTVRVSGFSADNTIIIGFGPPESEYEVLRQVRTDARGRVSASLTVPSWAERGRDYVWVAADRDNEPRVISEPFRVSADG